MNAKSASAARRNAIPQPEWRIRQELAACYRVFDHLGWIELIYNHITVRVPGAPDHFLINPFGLMYSEITASNLVKVDIDGNPIDAGEWGINPAGFILHSAVHAARPDIDCVMHTHTTAGMAVAGLKDGLSKDNFYGAPLHGKIAYHDYEGPLVKSLDEGPRIAASLADKNLLILRNHGLVACGTTIARTFSRLFTLERACQVQLATASMGAAINAIPEAAARRAAETASTVDPASDTPEKIFAALTRIIAAKDPGYAD